MDFGFRNKYIPTISMCSISGFRILIFSDADEKCKKLGEVA